MNKNILIFAFRYALGRMSTAPSLVVDQIISVMDQLSDSDLQLIVREIQEANNLGMQIDRAEWLRLVDLIKQNRF